jgi:hypothetical protein
MQEMGQLLQCDPCFLGDDIIKSFGVTSLTSELLTQFGKPINTIVHDMTMSILKMGNVLSEMLSGDPEGIADDTEIGLLEFHNAHSCSGRPIGHDGYPYTTGIPKCQHTGIWRWYYIKRRPL